MSTLPVIAAVDGSDDSTRALEWAVEEARLREAPLRIVHAVRTATPRGAEPPAGAAAPDSSVIVETRQALTGRPGLPELSFTTLDSTAASILPELGAEAQLLVLGSRGRGGFASLLLGSNGMACARDADSPVVVVPRPGRDVHTDAPEPAPGPRVVLGMSAEFPLTADAAPDPALAFAYREAAIRSARLHVVCAYPWPVVAWAAAGEYLPSAADQEAAEAECRQLVAERVATLKDTYPQVTVEAEVSPGDAAGHLVAAARGADLVVVGRHRPRAFSPVRMLGSVTHAVLLHAPAPVAVVPTAQELAEAAAATGEDAA
ncbi:universal stress protein [Streptomyces albidoflavus]|uniref:universal stress protein n=1 Tax=Streptomyces albidoflavus TaxID=1886 RepID=UPI001C44E614|nr:universal stress protein [Streptomyces albidoflavus]MBV7652506.1 universal stress protein [Streptomyces albidoflavus]MBV7713975.1 universal stress protein [Streptomyces albidoflavus]